MSTAIDFFINKASNENNLIKNLRLRNIYKYFYILCFLLDRYNIPQKVKVKV